MGRMIILVFFCIIYPTFGAMFNFASADVGAKVLANNSEAIGSHAVLTEDRDKYMINPCKAKKKYLVVELSDEVRMTHFVMANFEYYASSPKKFILLGSLAFPVKENGWQILGEFTASNKREIQDFPIANPTYIRFLKILLISFYGKEPYCTLSLVRVHGRNFVDDFATMESPILRPPSPSFSENVSPPPNEADKKVQQWLEAMKTHQDMGDGSKDSYQRLTSFLQGVLPTGTDTKSDPASTIASTTLNPPAVVSPISNLDNSNGMLNPSLGPNSLLTPTAQPFINHKENNDDSVYCSDSGQSCRCNIEVFGPVWSPFHMNTSKFYWGNSPQDYISSLVPNNQYSSQAPYTPFNDISNNEENKISYGNPVDTKLLGGLLFTSIPGLPTSWTQPNDSASNSDWVHRLKNLNVSLIPLNESHVILLPCGQGPSLNSKSPQGSPDSFSPNPHNTGRTTETQPHPNANENRIQAENVPNINTWDPLHSSSSPSSSGTFHKFDVLRLINNRVHMLENRALYYDATITEWKGKYGELLKTNAELKQELLVMKQLLYQAMNLVGKKWKEENETRHNTTEIINLQHKLNYTASRVKQLNNLLQDMDSIHKERMETLQNSINEIQRHIWIQMIGASLGTTMFLFLLFRAVGSTRWLLDVPRHRIRIQRPIFMDSDSMSGSPLLSKSGSMLQEMDSITLSEPMTPSGNNWGDLKALIYIPTLAEQSPPNDSPGPDSQNFTPREMSLLRDDRLGPSFERPDLESEGDECKRHEPAHLVHNQETEEDEEYLNLSCSKRDAPIDETTSAFDSS